MRSRRRRRGFTLIELLVVISIIGILVGLLLPAINSAREAGRRTQCQSNMRNVGLAVLGYVNSKNAFPPAGVFCEDPVNTLPNNPSTSVVLNYFPGSTGGSSSGVPMYSWVVPVLPYLDAQDMYNQWTMFNTASQTSTTGGSSQITSGVAFYDPTNYIAGQASNYTIATTGIGVLRCPDDVTAQPNQGNLSYVVNGGFTLWHPAAVGWAGSQLDSGQSTTTLTWVSGGAVSPTIGVAQKLGVFFIESEYPQGSGMKAQWNVTSTLTSLSDGASSTIMLSENTLAGVGSSNYTGGSATPTVPESNWACPIPNTTMFIGASNVCGGASFSAAGPNSCLTGLAPASVTSKSAQSGDADGPNWAFANKVGTFANINFAKNAGLTVEGSFPYSNSGHPGGCNMMFCDGAVRFISSTIDGTVYSKLITPGGSRLPFYCKQMPLSQDSFAQ